MNLDNHRDGNSWQNSLRYVSSWICLLLISSLLSVAFFLRSHYDEVSLQWTHVIIRISLWYPEVFYNETWLLNQNFFYGIFTGHHFGCSKSDHHNSDLDQLIFVKNVHRIFYISKYKQEVFRSGWNIDWLGSRFFFSTAQQTKFLLSHRVRKVLCDTWLLIMSKLGTALDVNCPLKANPDKNHASSRENTSVLIFEKKLMLFHVSAFSLSTSRPNIGSWI